MKYNTRDNKGRFTSKLFESTLDDKKKDLEKEIDEYKEKTLDNTFHILVEVLDKRGKFLQKKSITTNNKLYFETFIKEVITKNNLEL